MQICCERQCLHRSALWLMLLRWCLDSSCEYGDEGQHIVAHINVIRCIIPPRLIFHNNAITSIILFYFYNKFWTIGNVHTILTLFFLHSFNVSHATR